MTRRERTAELATLQLDVAEMMARERESAIRALASRVGRVMAESWVNDALEELPGYRGIHRLVRQRELLEALRRSVFPRITAWQKEAA
jgi:hypothetical protein